jgi:hypothetical protein
MKTLLVLINDPYKCDNIIKYATDMATDMRMNVHLLYIKNPASYAVTGSAASTPHPASGEIELAKVEEDKLNAVKFIENKLHSSGGLISSDIPVNVGAESGAMDLVVNR